MMDDLNALRANDARETIREKLEAEKAKLLMRQASRQVEARRRQQIKPFTYSVFPNPDQPQIDTFWDNATRLGQIMARGEGGTGTLGGAQIMGHVGRPIGSYGDSERAQSIQQPGMATWEADDIRRRAMAGLRKQAGGY